MNIKRTTGLAVVGVGLSAVTMWVAAPAGATPTTPAGTTFVNTNTAQKIVIADSQPNATFAAGATVQLVGPGAATNTITGTGTTVAGTGTCTPAVPPLPAECLTSAITTTLDFVTAGLPAGPGSYELSIYPSPAGVPGTSNATDEVAVTVTGAAPVPSGTVSPVVIKPGNNGPIKILGTGFANGDKVTSTAAGVTIATATPQGTATELDGTVTVGSAVTPGIYDLTVTDTAGKTGVCTGCLVVQGASVTDPTIASVDPSVVSAGTSQPISLTGTGFAAGMTVSLSNPTASAAPVAAVISSSTAASFAFPASLPAGVYDLSVTNTDTGTATLSQALTVNQAPFATSSTLTSSATHVIHGKPITLRGVLTRTTSTGARPVAGQTVYLLSQPDSGKTTVLKKLTTASNGVYKATFDPKANAKYAGYFAGDTGTASRAPDAASYSRVLRVTVAPLVIARATSSTTKHTSTLVVTGRVSPSESGRLLHLAQVNADGTTTRLATVVVDAQSHFTFRVKKPQKAGTYHLVVTIAAHSGLTAGSSKKFTIHRT